MRPAVFSKIHLPPELELQEKGLENLIEHIAEIHRNKSQLQVIQTSN
jgi:hypothetical protein